MLQKQLNLQIVPHDALFADLYEALDNLHTAASEGELQTVTSLTKNELLAWLNDMAYTIAETISEIEEDTAPSNSGTEPTLRVLRKGMTLEKEVSLAVVQKRQYGETGSSL